MQGRSWMAALTIAAGAVLVQGDSARSDDAPMATAVVLDMRIAGLTRDGCDIEIKPGHAGCQFKPVVEHITSSGTKLIHLKEIRVQNVNRDCAFAITIREPGQAVKTIHRGFRIPLPDANRPNSVASLMCCLNSPSKLARMEGARTRR
jgi:hypothetical protein